MELPGPPPSWGWGKDAHLLVGALSHSGAWRGVLAESEEQPYLIAALHGVSGRRGRLGGVTRWWRFDRMSTVCHPESGDLTASFAEAAKYYAVAVDVCPSRRGWRKGVVEKAKHSAAQRWWRTLISAWNIPASSCLGWRERDRGAVIVFLFPYSAPSLPSVSACQRHESTNGAGYDPRDNTGTCYTLERLTLPRALTGL